MIHLNVFLHHEAQAFSVNTADQSGCPNSVLAGSSISTFPVSCGACLYRSSMVIHRTACSNRLMFNPWDEAGSNRLFDPMCAALSSPSASDPRELQPGLYSLKFDRQGCGQSKRSKQAKSNVEQFDLFALNCNPQGLRFSLCSKACLQFSCACSCSGFNGLRMLTVSYCSWTKAKAILACLVPLTE